MGFDTKRLYQIELASEEALVNVIHHSYADLGGVIEIGIKANPGRLEIRICDGGAPFNPLAKRTPQQHADLSERVTGGLGLLFIRKCMDEVSYERKSNRNILTLIKKI